MDLSWLSRSAISSWMRLCIGVKRHLSEECAVLHDLHFEFDALVLYDHLTLPVLYMTREKQNCSIESAACGSGPSATPDCLNASWVFS